MIPEPVSCPDSSDRLGQAEVEDFHPARLPVEPDVARLNVAVDQLAFVGGGQSRGRLPADAQHLGQRQPAFALQPIFQRLALQERHGQEGHAPVFIHMVDRDDVLVLDGGRGLGLAQEALPGGGVAGQRGPNDLEGHAAPELPVLGLEDDAHAPGAEYLEDAVPSQPADLARPLGLRQHRDHLMGDLIGLGHVCVAGVAGHGSSRSRAGGRRLGGCAGGGQALRAE